MSTPTEDERFLLAAMAAQILSGITPSPTANLGYKMELVASSVHLARAILKEIDK